MSRAEELVEKNMSRAEGPVEKKYVTSWRASGKKNLKK